MALRDGVLKNEEGSKTLDDLAERFREAMAEELVPHTAYVIEGLERAHRLVRAAVDHLRVEDTDDSAKLAERQQASEDIIRSIVVLSHAYLEDFLRTLGKIFLPLGDEATLNEIPLVGGDVKRPEKFFLGKLAGQRGRSVDEVIRKSVEEYVNRMSFNNTNEIVSFLSYIGLKVDEDVRSRLPSIDAMIQRRHLIVHRADRIDGKIQPVNSTEVLDWARVSMEFMQGLFQPLLAKKFTPEIVAKKFNIKLAQS